MRAFTEKHGYPLLEAISALQKDIRRGNERQAMYWAMELIPKYEKYLWRRLMVIANEDIGIASPTVLGTIPELHRMFFLFRGLGKNGTARLILANAILLMCRAPKSRIADHFQRCVTQQFMDSPALEIPDYALDNHTSTGRSKGRGVEFWLEEGCKLTPEGEVPDPYREEAEVLWLNGKDDAPEWKWRKKVEDDPQMKLF